MAITTTNCGVGPTPEAALEDLTNLEKHEPPKFMLYKVDGDSNPFYSEGQIIARATATISLAGRYEKTEKGYEDR